MNSYSEPDYDDTVCVTCGRKLPEEVQPWSWNDHGFCSVGCATSYTSAFDLRGVEPVLELARMGGGGRGPGFEESLIRSWRTQLAEIPDGILWLSKQQATESAGSWAWRVYLTNIDGTEPRRCVAFRLTPKGETV